MKPATIIRRPPQCTRTIHNALFRFALLLILSSIGWAQSPASLALLTHADQVRHLTAEEAARSYPVRIRGVITDDVPSPDFFVQDATAGIYPARQPCHGET